MSKLRDKFAAINKLADEIENNDNEFLAAIESLGFHLANPEAALKGQQWGKLGALDLLNTDEYFGQLMSQPNKQAAIDFVFQTIDTLDNGLAGFEQYNKLGDDTKRKLQFAFQKARKVEDIAFTLSNFGLSGAGFKVSSVEELGVKLASSNLNVNSSLRSLLSNPNAKEILETLSKLFK